MPNKLNLKTHRGISGGFRGSQIKKSLGRLSNGWTDWHQIWYTSADSSGNGHRLNTILTLDIWGGGQCLIQDKISTSPSPTDRRAVVAPHGRRAARSSRRAVAYGRHIGRYFYLIILPLLIILLSLKSNFIIL